MSPSLCAVKQRRLLRRLVAGAVVCVLGSALATAACIVAPPPDLPPAVAHRPTILHDSVVPPADQILTSAEVPDGGALTFLVPVELDDPSRQFSWELFIDYDPYTASAPFLYGQVQPTASTVDAGTVVVAIPLSFQDGRLSTPYCHRVEFLVAYTFSAFHTPDSLGGDIVTWLYNGAGGLDGCPLSYDASALGDSGWSPADAPADQLPIVPESGSDP
jgi:hypothetical protein